jgi:putative SOS response-associated peptidase YedK
MCGRFSLHSNPHVVGLQFGLTHVPEYVARYNVAPGKPILAVRADERHGRIGVLLRWGLVPSWAKDPSIGHRMINARAEHIAEKPAFRSALRRRRCIVPADGFYEWRAAGARKQPYYVRPREQELFGFAGLYEYWKGPEGVVGSCTVITTEANALMRPLHDRMPAILDAADYAHWLDGDHPDPEALVAVLRPAPAERMIAYPVGLQVNNVRNDDPSLIEPGPVVETPTSGTLL